MSLVGMTISEAKRATGRTHFGLRYHLSTIGLRVDGVTRRIVPQRTATEVEDEILARVAARPPVAPCFKCGARGECKHR